MSTPVQRAEARIQAYADGLRRRGRHDKARAVEHCLRILRDEGRAAGNPLLQQLVKQLFDAAQG